MSVRRTSSELFLHVERLNSQRRRRNKNRMSPVGIFFLIACGVYNSFAVLLASVYVIRVRMHGILNPLVIRVGFFLVSVECDCAATRRGGIVTRDTCRAFVNEANYVNILQFGDVLCKYERLGGNEVDFGCDKQESLAAFSMLLCAALLVSALLYFICASVMLCTLTDPKKLVVKLVFTVTKLCIVMQVGCIMMFLGCVFWNRVVSYTDLLSPVMEVTIMVSYGFVFCIMATLLATIAPCGVLPSNKFDDDDDYEASDDDGSSRQSSEDMTLSHSNSAPAMFHQNYMEHRGRRVLHSKSFHR